MSYAPDTVTQDEIDSFVDRFNLEELTTIRNAAQDAMLADKSEVVITALNMDSGGGTGQLTGKPRYLMVLAQRAIGQKNNAGGVPGVLSSVNFSTRRCET